jgi:adenylylsulfate reductase, thioredoxin dependent
MTAAVALQRPALWQIPQPQAEVFAHLPEKTAQLRARVQDICARFQRVKFASSLAVEDMVITEVLAQLAAPVEVFMLETGRLNAETLAYAEVVRARYPALNFRLYRPDAAEVAAYVETHGLNAFYQSVELRKRCCFIRKVAPLNRALADADAWLTGQRRAQSVTRSALALQEADEARGIAKFNPIYDWSEDDVWAYIQQNAIPFNALYHQGYPSIGCEPCTIAVKAGEDIRAGRWWWENKDSRECGLHK